MFVIIVLNLDWDYFLTITKAQLEYLSSKDNLLVFGFINNFSEEYEECPELREVEVNQERLCALYDLIKRHATPATEFVVTDSFDHILYTLSQKKFKDPSYPIIVYHFGEMDCFISSGEYELPIESTEIDIFSEGGEDEEVFFDFEEEDDDFNSKNWLTCAVAEGLVDKLSLVLRPDFDYTDKNIEKEELVHSIYPDINALSNNLRGVDCIFLHRTNDFSPPHLDEYLNHVAVEIRSLLDNFDNYDNDDYILPRM